MGESLYISNVGPFENKNIFRPEIPRFDPRIFGIESQHASNELPSASVLNIVKMQAE